MKIMVVMGEYPPEENERRRQAVLNCSSPGTDIGFAVIKATFFRRSNSQVNSLSAGPLVAEVAVKAEADGYDAVVPFGTLDAGAWRVADAIVAIRSVEIPLPESTKNRDAMRERFIQVGRELIDNHDAEIIVPMGVTMVPVQYSPREFERELGVPVMDALKTSIQTAEMMVRMNLTHSTKTYPRPPAS